MASTASTILRLELLANGENANTWGTKTNTNLQMIEAAVSGTTSLATTGGTSTLANVDYTVDASKRRVLDVTGVLASNSTIVIPNASKLYRVFNRTSGAFTVTIKTSSGSGIEVTQSTVADIYCDGADVVRYAGPITDYTTGAPATSSGAAASSVSVVPSGGLSSTNVQAALSELQGDIDAINVTFDGYQPLDSDLTTIATLANTKGNLMAGTGSAWSSLSVGTNGYAMIADSAATTGMKWAALIPAGTVVIFYQASAPTGWAVSGSESNYALRLVSSGAGSAVAGTAFTTVFNDRTIVKTNLPDFGITITDPGHVHPYSRTASLSSQATGTDNSLFPSTHYNGYSTQNTSNATTGITAAFGSTARGGAQTTMDFQVAYINVMKCAKSAY